MCCIFFFAGSRLMTLTDALSFVDILNPLVKAAPVGSSYSLHLMVGRCSFAQFPPLAASRQARREAVLGSVKHSFFFVHRLVAFSLEIATSMKKVWCAVMML